MKKKDIFLSTIKGFITGIASLVPAISPASVVFALDGYENFIEGLNNPNKKNKKFLYVTIPIILGILIGLLSGKNLIDTMWSKYKMQILLLFIGLFIGKFKIDLNRKTIKISLKNIILFLLVLSFFLIINFLFKDKLLSIENNIFSIMFLSIVLPVSLFVPGVSIPINYFLNFVNKSNIFYIIVLIIIFIMIFIIMAIIVSKVYNKHKDKFYIIMFALLSSNIVISIFNISNVKYNFSYIFTSVLAFMWGYILAINITKE